MDCALVRIIMMSRRVFIISAATPSWTSAVNDLQIDLTTLDVSKESADYKEVYFALIAHLLQEQKTRGIYLAGPPGVGKSYLCIGVCNY